MPEQRHSTTLLVTVAMLIVLPVLTACPAREPERQQPLCTASGSTQLVPGGAQESPASSEDTQPPVPAALAGKVSAEQWWGDGCDPHNQGYTASIGPDSAELLRSHDVGQLNGHLGLLPDGTIIVGHPTGVTALDQDGTVRWEASGVGDEVDFTISLVPEPRVCLRSNSYVEEAVTTLGKVPGSYFRRVCRLTALDTNGKECWRTDIDGSIQGVPCLDRSGGIIGLLMVSKPQFHRMGHMESYSEYAELVRVAADGKLEWHKILPRLEPVSLPPNDARLVMLRNGNVGFTWVDTTFHVFSADSFREWDYKLVSIPDCPASVSPVSMILLPANDRPTLTEKQLRYMNWEAMNQYGILHSIRDSGARHWDLQVGSDIHTQVAISAVGWIHFGSTVFVDDRAGQRSNGLVYALNTKGQLQYSYATRADISDYPAGAPPLVDGDGTLYITDSGGNIYAIDAAGKLKWETTIEGQFTTNPVIANGMLCIGTADGSVFMFGGK